MPIVNRIFALVGPSGAGKTALMEAMLERFPTQLRIMRSVTTRPRRGQEDDRWYSFVTREEFRRLIQGGGLIQWVEFAGHYYGSDRKEINALLEQHHLIQALVEDGVNNFLREKYALRVIRILPVGAAERPGRTEADLKRQNSPIPIHLELRNNFSPGGFQIATSVLTEFIGASMGIEAQLNRT